MSILGELLPGLRHLRSTLVAGYLWLLLIWLAVSPDLDSRPDDRLAAAAYDLASYFGTVGVGIAAGIAAFLCGAVMLPLATVLGWAWDYLYFRRYGNVVFEGFERVLSDDYHRALAVAAELRPDMAEDVHQALLREIEDRSNAAFRDVESELDLPSTLLVGDKDALFSEVDRLRSDGEFRISLGPPLAGLIILLAISSGIAFLLFLLALIPLQWQGAHLVRQSRLLVANAMEYGQAESPSAKKFATWVDDLPVFVKSLPEKQSPPRGLEFH